MCIALPVARSCASARTQPPSGRVSPKPHPRPVTPARSSTQRRQVKCSFKEAYRERVRDYHITEPYAKAMRKRHR
jgi:hypothetical protein